MQTQANVAEQKKRSKGRGPRALRSASHYRKLHHEHNSAASSAAADRSGKWRRCPETQEDALSSAPLTKDKMIGDDPWRE